MLHDPNLRTRAKELLGIVFTVISERTPPGTLPVLTSDEYRAANLFLRVFEATIDEFQAANPPKYLAVGKASKADLRDMFGQATRPSLS